jgi:sulfur-oxidizing protein SoxX
MRTATLAWALVFGTGLAAGVVGGAGAQDDVAARAAAVMKASFKARGQAGLDRLDQDETQRLCSQASGKAPPKDAAERIEKANLASIKWPADGKYLGDWKNGEKIAQEGRGKQYSDDPAGPVGGNCYACHQLDPKEVSYGTIGPSLLGFGKLRAFAPDEEKNAYGKIYNSDAYDACSNMPRFGHNGILTEQQIKDLVALLMDPASPVNK